MALEDFIKTLDNNHIYLNSHQSYSELYETIYKPSSRVTNEDIVAELNNLTLHYYPDRNDNLVLRGISKEDGKEVFFETNKKVKTNIFKYIKYPYGITETVPINKTYVDMQNDGDLVDILGNWYTKPYEYFDCNYSIIANANTINNKFIIKVKKDKKIIIEKTYKIVNKRLTKEDYLDIINVVNNALTETIKPYHKDKLNDYLIKGNQWV